MKKSKMRIAASDPEYLRKVVEFVEDSLKERKIKSKMLIQTVMLAEEIVVSFVDHASEGAEIAVAVEKSSGDICVDISVPGTEIDRKDLKAKDTLDFDVSDPDQEDAIRAIVVRAYGEKLKYSHKKGMNNACISAGKAERSTLIATMIALGLGLFVGLLASLLLPEKAAEGMCTYAFEPVKTMFMNALGIIVAPVVFFSIVTCLSQFKNLSEFGRVGGKVMGMYLLTTLIASGIAVFFSLLFSPGEWGAGLSGTAEQVATTSMGESSSFLNSIINIVPDNFLKPFVESDTLQLIFLAVICGFAVGMIGKYSSLISNILEACNQLFLTITTMVSRVIPVAVFCSIAQLVIELGTQTLLNVLSMAGTFLVSVAVMMAVYVLLVLFIGHLNPIVFFRKEREGMLTSFALSSSSAAMPTNLRVCTEKLGISPKIAKFSIPLGATVNMDGASICFIVSALFLAKMYGITVTGPMMVSMVAMVVMLSLGTPGVPGSGLVCLGVLLEHLGIPLASMGLVIAINPLIDMFVTMNNTTGDVAVTTIVAKSEGLLDKKIFYSK